MKVRSLGSSHNLLLILWTDIALLLYESLIWISQNIFVFVVKIRSFCVIREQYIYLFLQHTKLCGSRKYNCSNCFTTIFLSKNIIDLGWLTCAKLHPHARQFNLFNVRSNYTIWPLKTMAKYINKISHTQQAILVENSAIYLVTPNIN